ncbi:MAG: FtsX-like permease family protein [Betaproteobacteria bacterium]|nr:FtsX-like permease family protein [Betaproteobacteria bacterium]
MRYTRSRQRTRVISFISAISVIGIALGMTVLITVLSVMNGFQREIRTRILSVASHVQVSAAGGKLADWERVAAEAARHPEVVAAAPYVTAQGLLTHGSAVRGAFVRGVLPEREELVAEIGKHMRSGRLENLKPGEFGIVLGREIFHVDHFEFDSGLALMHLEDAQKLFRFDDAVSGVRLRLKDLFQAAAVAREVVRALGPDFYASDWTLQHANFFRAVQIEKRMMFLIVLLIIAVAAFNIVSSLMMAVKDKNSDIAILRTLGASPTGITRIFLIQGTMIGLLGTLLGLIGGVSLALNVETVVPFIENLFGFKFLAKDVYQISDLPSELQTPDVVTTAAVSFLLTLLATIYPSYRAAKVNPAEALRYE